MKETAKASKARKSKETALKEEREAAWRKKLEEGRKSPKVYSMDQVYRLDDRVDHKIFGLGLVVSLIPPDKINVFFQAEGLKMMKCGGEDVSATA